jgi:hypothetical protein
MSEGKQQAEWERVGSIMVNARLAMVNKEGIAPIELIPKRYRPKPPKLSKEQEKRAAEIGWTMFAVNMFKGKR